MSEKDSEENENKKPRTIASLSANLVWPFLKYKDYQGLIDEIQKYDCVNKLFKNVRKDLGAHDGDSLLHFAVRILDFELVTWLFKCEKINFSNKNALERKNPVALCNHFYEQTGNEEYLKMEKLFLENIVKAIKENRDIGTIYPSRRKGKK